MEGIEFYGEKGKIAKPPKGSMIKYSGVSDSKTPFKKPPPPVKNYPVNEQTPLHSKINPTGLKAGFKPKSQIKAQSSMTPFDPNVKSMKKLTADPDSFSLASSKIEGSSTTDPSLSQISTLSPIPKPSTELGPPLTDLQLPRTKPIAPGSAPVQSKTKTKPSLMDLHDQGSSSIDDIHKGLKGDPNSTALNDSFATSSFLDFATEKGYSPEMAGKIYNMHQSTLYTEFNKAVLRGDTDMTIMLYSRGDFPKGEVNFRDSVKLSLQISEKDKIIGGTKESHNVLLNIINSSSSEEEALNRILESAKPKVDFNPGDSLYVFDQEAAFREYEKSLQSKLIEFSDTSTPPSSPAKLDKSAADEGITDAMLDGKEPFPQSIMDSLLQDADELWGPTWNQDQMLNIHEEVELDPNVFQRFETDARQKFDEWKNRLHEIVVGHLEVYRPYLDQASARYRRAINWVTDGDSEQLYNRLQNYVGDMGNILETSTNAAVESIRGLRDSIGRILNNLPWYTIRSRIVPIASILAAIATTLGVGHQLLKSPNIDSSGNVSVATSTAPGSTPDLTNIKDPNELLKILIDTVSKAVEDKLTGQNPLGFGGPLGAIGNLPPMDTRAQASIDPNAFNYRYRKVDNIKSLSTSIRKNPRLLGSAAERVNQQRSIYTGYYGPYDRPSLMRKTRGNAYSYWRDLAKMNTKRAGFQNPMTPEPVPSPIPLKGQDPSVSQ